MTASLSARPRRPVPAVGVGAADAVVGHLHHQRPFVRSTSTVAWLADAYLATFVSASATTK